MTPSRCRVTVLIAGVAYAGAAIAGLNDISVPLVGVSLTSLTMAAVGSSCAFAWAPAEISRGKLFFVAAASTIVGATCVGVIPEVFFKVMIRPELQPPLAFLFGLIAPWVVPALKGAIPAFFKGLSAMLIRMVGTKMESGDNYGEGQYVPREYNPRKTDEGED